MAGKLGVMVIAGHGAQVASLVERLKAKGEIELITAANREAALDAIDAQAADVMLIDAASLGADAAAELVRETHGRWADLPIIELTNADDPSHIVVALENGVSDVLSHGADDELSLALARAFARAARAPVLALPARAVGELVLGRSPAMQVVAKRLDQIAPSAASVLVRGESGTGKELVARALHRLSPLAQNPFIKIDCASLPDALLESELFGYEKGAFTGATTRKLGRVELAHTGVLFLDEVGELSLSTQAKLLRLLQDREFERLGGTSTLHVDVRVIAATHRDLEAMVSRAQFRQDLFYRLNVVPIWLPPLRARRDDVEDLAHHFCQQAATRNQRPEVSLGRDALRLLSAQRWPGNVRQLQNFVERLVVLATHPIVDERDVQGELDRPTQFATETSAKEVAIPGNVPNVASGDAVHLSQVVRDAERSALLRAIERAGGNRSAAARILGVSRSTFYAKLREYDLL